MKYVNTVEATFLDRPNRFVANVRMEDGRIETVHVKNTGRCREILLPGVDVILQDAKMPCELSGADVGDFISNYNMDRKTRYDLIGARKEGMGWINIDSQVPNKIVADWLARGEHPFGDITFLKPEYRFGSSRVDFYIENHDSRILMEVKGCTLEIDGEGYFPDAPTDRGVKHLYELADAAQKGYVCYIAFVIAMNGIDTVHPHKEIHPEFAKAFDTAVQKGVKVLYLCCEVQKDSITVARTINI